ncbi:MAG: phosphoribosylanthranilate isomerase [Verrucomicrobiae bacterium]|nr:phosphoribosylanthranilate isomerase [Verrucomicrobiae bacterium]
MVRVKICGITNLRDARLAVRAGADALGFIFAAESPRRVTRAQAAAICRRLPPLVARVGVFVNAPAEEIRRTAAACGLDAIQLHGEEPPSACRRLPARTIKAFRLRHTADLRLLRRYPVDAWLVDAFAKNGRRGGTGRLSDWTLARRAARMGRPVFLSGGLTPENVASAIRAVRPYAVDACSGVERAPGRKDPAKLTALIRAARAAPGLAARGRRR